MISRQLLDKAINGKTEERVYLCGKSFELFFTYYYLHYIKYPFAPFHYDMFGDIEDLMEGKYREVLWLMFRESAKTSLAKGFITWLLCYGKRKYINVDSFEKENSERTLFDIVVELQTNQKLLGDFGHLYNIDRSPDEVTQKRVSNFVTNNGVRVETHSTQESVRGRVHGNQRPDALILEDFETNKTKDSKAYTQQVISHINEFMAGLDSQAVILYTANYITEYGSVQELINRAKTDKRVLIRNVPAIKDNKPTWPAKYDMTDEEAKISGKVSLEDKKKQLGSSVFSAEMMNEPVDAETQEFFKEKFKYRTREELDRLRTRQFATIDSALTKNADSDYTGIVKNWVDEKNNWNLQANQYKVNSKELINIIFQLHDEGFEKIGIEEGAFTEAVEPFFQEECTKRNKYPYIVKLKHGGVMKESRIRGLIPRYEAGGIYHLEGECQVLEEQLIKFPKGVNDDVADALAYQYKIAEQPYPQEAEQIVEDKPLYPGIGI
jgi:phage terminase large subunit-like protein